MNEPHKLIYEDVYKYYIIENHTREESADYFNLDQSSFIKYLRANKISKNRSLMGKNGCRSLKERNRKMRPSYQEFYNYYIIENNSRANTAKKFGITESRVKCIAKEYNCSKSAYLSNQNTKQTMKLKYTEEEISNQHKKVIEARKLNGTLNPFRNKTDDEIRSITQKCFQTKLKNGTTNSSSDEDISYDILLDIYSNQDIIRQYRSDAYPFACDFYIIPEDLYIECNYHWTHGGHPYDKDNEEDQKQLEKWKIKSANSNFYKRAIYVWTDLDVRKNKSLNDLGGLVFYSIREFKEYFQENI